MRPILVTIVAAALLTGCIKEVEQIDTARIDQQAQPTIFEGEKHFANLKQLTFGGQNAEAYFSYDASELIFQSTRDLMECDAIFRMNADGSNVRMVSSGQGVTTCSFIAPDGQSIIYASTHLAGSACPPKPDMSRGYTWALYDSYDIFKADPDGSNLVRLTETDGYDAESVFSPQGDKIVFTSVRDGDLDLYMMNPDGGNVERLTNEIGYDGGAFFSLDGKSICWRASRPGGDELNDYLELLADGLIRPSNLEIYVMNLEEREPIQLTGNGAANFGSYFHPDGKRVIFASNMADPQGRNFDLFVVDIETKELEQITHFGSFDGFPMFSHDGKKLVFASNRDGSEPGETNVFIADWVD